MKRTLHLLLIFPLGLLAQTVPINIQPTYRDALRLVALHEAYIHNNDNVARSIIHTDMEKIAARYEQLGHSLDTNPYLRELFGFRFASSPGNDQKDFHLHNSDKDLSSQDRELGAAATQSIGWQASVINGLSSFMAGRFRQEILHYGLDNVFGKILKEDSLLFNALLPTTLAEINKLKKGNAYYSADIVFLRQVIQEDLGRLPLRIGDSVEVLFPKINDMPLAGEIVGIASTIHQTASKGASLPELIYQLSNKRYGDYSLQNHMRLINLYSEALRDTAGSRRLWADLTTLQGNLGNEVNVRNVFFGLLYEQIRFMGYEISQMENIRNTLTLFVDLNAAEQYVSAKAYTLSLDEGTQFVRQIGTAITDYLHAAQQDNLGLYVPEGSLKLLSKTLNVVKPFQDKDYQQGIITLIKELGAFLPGDPETGYRRTLIFAVQLADTKNENDMEALLHAYALPIGGSSIKRSGTFNVSLNGYVGFTGGRELAYGSSVNQTKWNVGLSAPIGVSTTFGANWTVFASIIDLGSIVNVRINNDTTAFTDLRFEHFFTPGVGLYYNWSKTPVTMGVHYSYIPNLRNIAIEDAGATVTESGVSVSRFNFSVLIDIPFFTFYNRSRQ